MKVLIVGILLVVLHGTCFCSSQTSSFQCMNGIVSVGDTYEEVMSKCGQPSGKVHTERAPLTGSDAYRARNTYVYESHWTYNPGPNGFIYHLEFRGGKVRAIENTERYGTR